MPGSRSPSKKRGGSTSRTRPRRTTSRGRPPSQQVVEVVQLAEVPLPPAAAAPAANVSAMQQQLRQQLHQPVQDQQQLQFNHPAAETPVAPVQVTGREMRVDAAATPR